MTESEALEKHKEDCRRCKDKACERNIQCLQKKDIEVIPTGMYLDEERKNITK